MGSKRSKKSKQELEMLSDKNNVKKSKERDDNSDSEVGNYEADNNDTDEDVLKAPKRKKKHEGSEEVPKKLKKTSDGGTETKKIKAKKKKNRSDSNTSLDNDENDDQVPMNGETEEMEPDDNQKDGKSDIADKKKEEITWPNDDIIQLINRMESNIPEKDVLAYRSRVEKLNWDNIAFKEYTAQECRQTWIQVQKRIRRFRLLREVLNDAKEWVMNPKINNKVPRPKKHPDMPRRPLSSYLLFYLKKKDQILSENPGLDGSDITKIVGQIYKNLPPEKREKYEKLAAENREEYLEKLKVFFETHPELVPPKSNNKLDKEKPPKVDKVPKQEKEKVPKVEKDKATKTEKDKKADKDKPKGEKRLGRPPKLDKSPKIPKERPPKKFQTPFGMYYAAELKNMDPGMDKSEFKLKCKTQYRQMSDKKKMYWITLAEQDLIRYQEEAKAYKEKHPDFQALKVRPILTKKEKVAKERASGKPSKPPNSAYALYSRVMLQSEEIKSVHPRERMNYIANKWKNASEEEKNSYRDQVVNLLEEYKQQYASYLDSLPEEERKKLTQSKRKSKKISIKTNRIKKPKKRKSIKKDKPSPSTKTKFTEPEQPPISACKYFATLYKGDGDPVQAWKALPPEEKRKYEEELVKKKQAYIVEFERFLKSLSKEELEAFSKSRQQQMKSDDEEDSSGCSSDSEGDEEEEEEEDDNDENGENADDMHDSDSD